VTLSPPRGVTVFSPTPYLEEAYALAGRVGIIDHARSSPMAPPPS